VWAWWQALSLCGKGQGEGAASAVQQVFGLLF